MTKKLRVASIGECMIEVAQGADAVRLGFGGDTLNTAVYLARTGGPDLAVSFVTVLGQDPFSQRMVESWRREGIDCAMVLRDPQRLPGLYVIATDPSGERSFFYWREQAAARGLMRPDRAAGLARLMSGYDLVYLSGITLAIVGPEGRGRLLDLLDGLRAGGTRVAFDSNYRPRLWSHREQARDAVARLGARVDLALPSAGDEMTLFGLASARAVAERWLEQGAGATVVTDGAAPAVVADAAGIVEVPAVPSSSPPLDTTAAGDAFNAGFLASHLRGVGLVEAARAGHTLAAQVVRFPGAIIPR